MWLDPALKLIGLARRNARLADWSPELAAIFGMAPTAAGVSVTPETALQSPTFLAAVRVISETLGAMPIHLYEKGADGSRARNSDHPAAKLLSGDWSPWEAGADTRTTLQVDAILHGEAFAQVLRVSGRPKEIHRLDPRGVSIDRTGDEPVFKVRVNGQERRLDWREVLYIATPGSAPGRPMSLVNLLREAIGLDLVMAQHQARVFSNGARPSGVLKAGPNPVSPEKLNFLGKQFAEHAREGSGRTLILEDGFDFKQVQFSSVDLQFLELRRLAGQDIARGMKVPATLVGDFDRAVWKNVEELSRQFLQTCLIPWIERWIGALSRTLLTPAERETMYLEFIPEDLLRGDLVGRFTAYRQAAGGAWLTPNEVRALENRPPIEGGDELILQAGQGAPTPEPTPEPKSLRAVA